MKFKLIIVCWTLVGLALVTQTVKDRFIILSDFSLMTVVVVMSLALLSMIFRFLRFVILMENESKKDQLFSHTLFFSTLPLVVIYPFRSGEILRLVVLSRFLGFGNSVSLIFFERLFDLLCVSLIITIFGFWISSASWSDTAVNFIYFSGILILMLLFFMCVLLLPRILVYLEVRKHQSLKVLRILAPSALTIYRCLLGKIKIVQENFYRVMACSLAAATTDIAAILTSMSVSSDLLMSIYREILVGNRFGPAFDEALLYNILVMVTVISMAALSLLLLHDDVKRTDL